MPFFGNQRQSFGGNTGGSSSSFSKTSNASIFGLQAISAIGSAYVDIQNIKARSEALRFSSELKAQVAEINARIARENRDRAVALKRKEIKRLTSTQRALFGKAGVQISESARQVIEETGLQGDMAALAIKFAGDVDVQNELISASTARLEGRQASAIARIGTASAILRGTSRIIKSASEAGLLEGK